MKNQESQEIELDVVSLFKTLWRRKFSILITALLFAIGALGYSAFVAKKIYQSTSRIYVVSRQNQENNALTNQDLQAGSYLVKDYREIILSQNVLNQAIEELKLEMLQQSLLRKSQWQFQRILGFCPSQPQTQIHKKQLVSRMD